MKPLYYLEFAQSVRDGKSVPVNELNWHTHPSWKIAYEDRELCDHKRIAIQENTNDQIIRVTKATPRGNSHIRNSARNSGRWNWIVVEG